MKKCKCEDLGEYGRHLREVVERHRKLPLSEQRIHGRVYKERVAKGEKL